MKLIDFFKVIAQLSDAEMIIVALLKSPSLSSLDQDYYQIEFERIRLQKLQLSKLLDKEQYWTTAREDRSKKALMSLELSDNYVITQLILESQTTIEGLRKTPAFNDLYKNFATLRSTLMELLVTEHQFISDYQKISADKSHLYHAIDKYFSLKTSSLVSKPEEYKRTLNTYDKATNYLAMTLEDLTRFSNDIWFGIAWLENKIFATTDFMNFYEYQLLPWSLAYSALSELFNLVKLAADEKKIPLTPEELEAINHVVSRLIGAVQRLGRYKLLLDEIKKLTEAILTPDSAFILATDRSPSRIMVDILKFFSVKNKMIERTIGAINYPNYLLNNISELIRKLSDISNEMSDTNRTSLQLFAAAKSPFEKAQIDCAKLLIADLEQLLMFFKQELTRLNKTPQSQNTFDLSEYNLYDVYSRKTREALRMRFREVESGFQEKDSPTIYSSPLYLLLNSYCQKMQPCSTEDKTLVAEHRSLVKIP